MIGKLGDPERRLEEEIGHVRGLVLIRRMLAERGAPEAELRECDIVIARCRSELAELAGRAGACAA